MHSFILFAGLYFPIKIPNMAFEFLEPSAVACSFVETPIRIYDGEDFDFEDVRIAIFGVEEERGFEENKGCKDGPEKVREAFYKLRSFPANVTIADLGNIPAGRTYNDTQVAISVVIEDLLKKNIIPLLIGGDQSLAYGQFKGYQKMEQLVNFTLVDERFSLYDGGGRNHVYREDFLYQILTHRPAYLYNFSVVGYQSYFVYQEHLELLTKMHFESIRLGKVRQDLREMEPYVRDADMLCFNIAALRSFDAPGFCQSTPNGFFGDEACQLMWYAGISDKVSSAGIYDYNPEYDMRGQTAQVVAQMIWYFILGVSQRKADYPVTNLKDFNKFIVTVEGREEDIIFLKSKKSDRWWIQVPKSGGKTKGHYLVSCTYGDYQKALDGEIPGRLVTAISKQS